MLNVSIGEQWVGLIKEAVLEQSFKTDFGKVFSEDKRQVPVLVQVLTGRMGMDAAFVQDHLVHRELYE